jgi:beta-glucanase (GH16 family)
MTSVGLLFALLLVQAAAPVSNNYRVDEAMARPANARLVWSDEFDGHALDPARWSYDTARNRQGWYNGELQYYAAGRPENVRVENGHLIIEARREALDPARYPDWGGQHYTSGRILTRGHASWTYGFFEVRAKLPCARGTWPAIWLLPDTGAWPEGGEIDVIEMVGSEPEVVHATVHSALFVHTRGTQRGAAMPLPGACGAFHDYQLDWRPDSITIGVDGRAYMRVRNDQPGGRAAWPFDAPFHLILNLAMGGAWAAARGMDDAALPQRMEVDYVRVWQVPR